MSGFQNHAEMDIDAEISPDAVSLIVLLFSLCLYQNNNSDVTQYFTDKFFSSSKFFKISLVAATFYLAIISIMHLKHLLNIN